GIEGVTGALDRVVLRGLVLRDLAAVLQLPRRGEIRVVVAVRDVAAALDQQRLEPALAQFLGGPTATDPGADDDGIEIHERSDRGRAADLVERQARAPRAGH